MLQKLDVDDISPQKPQEGILPKEAFNVSAIKLDKAPEFSELIKPELLRISNADYIISSKMGLTVVYYKDRPYHPRYFALKYKLKEKDPRRANQARQLVKEAKVKHQKPLHQVNRWVQLEPNRIVTKFRRRTRNSITTKIESLRTKEIATQYLGIAETGFCIGIR